MGMAQYPDPFDPNCEAVLTQVISPEYCESSNLPSVKMPPGFVSEADLTFPTLETSWN